MSEYLPEQYKRIVYEDLQEALDGLKIGIDLGGDDHVFVEAVVELLMKTLALGRQTQAHHADLAALWSKVAEEKGYVGPLDETKAMPRDIIEHDQVEEEVVVDPKLQETIMLLGPPVAPDETEGEVDSIVEVISQTAAHKREAQAS